jgi:hypothetical protein
MTAKNRRNRPRKDGWIKGMSWRAVKRQSRRHRHRRAGADGYNAALDGGRPIPAARSGL